MSRPDQTGLVLVGRSRDGRYRYRSVSGMGARNVVQLTQDQRVGLAILRLIAQEVRPGTQVYPMTRQSSALGYGMRGGRQIWIQRPLLSGEHPERAMSTFEHELGHNAQSSSSKPHGPEFKAAHVRMTCAVKKATRDYTRWPKLNMRELRDTIPPAQKKRTAAKKRAAAKAAETPEERWTRKLASSERLLADWETKSAAAERKVEAWTKKVAHAKAWLRRSQK